MFTLPVPYRTFIRGSGLLPTHRRRTVLPVLGTYYLIGNMKLSLGTFFKNLEGLNVNPSHSILLLFVLLPDCSQNQTTVSDIQHLLSDF
jgi:hypothetical protein